MKKARKINDIADLEAVSSSKVIKMESYNEVKSLFEKDYNIKLEGFEKKKLMDVKSSMAGFDDMLKEFPEIKQAINIIRYEKVLEIVANGALLAL